MLSAPPAAAPPPVGHVFVINLENKGFDETWGPDSKAPYLSRTLRAQGNLLTQYYGTAHNSLGNYLAQISGQGPNAETQADCQTYSPFRQTGTAAPGQAVGQGCVYPSSVPTLAGQLTGSGRSWKGYMEDMGTPCRHPRLGAVDDTQQARVGDQYAARHNPFVYFASITGSPECAADDVDLSALPRDLFWDGYGNHERKISLAAEMIVPKHVEDDLGAGAKATTTFLRYELTLGYLPPEGEGSLGRLALLHEELKHITRGEAPKHLKFRHSAKKFRNNVVTGQRRGGAFLSTEVRDSGIIVNIHGDGGSFGRPQPRAATRAGRTVLSTVTTNDHPTIHDSRDAELASPCS